MERKRINQMVQIALIGALYTVLTLVVAPISFSTVQFRISEALTLLPLFSPVGNMGGFKNFLQLFRLDLLNSFLFLLWLQINH